MEIKVEEVIINKENSSVVGWVRVDLAGKMTIIMTVLKGNRGLFAKMPSAKINGEFRSCISWVDPEVEKKIIAAIMPEVTRKLEAKPSNDPSGW